MDIGIISIRSNGNNFHFGAIMSNAAANIVYKSLCGHASHLLIPSSSGTAVPYGNSMINLLR